ncbi:putative acetyltransferase [Roseibium hamelinense]|uniref:Putative acetyltransferase n=1 Tax=Roseibium hamelinense TaxID=150831 RepID=A0A562SHT6_9HYPH|nr:N-acetyltransferase [Roseibium hamelinense]MTI43903.1 N-acetyltransferase [Roseibium hamelinense]TWI80802.1 putative acetyltransferase [Roseibium hamelinense]
MTIPEPDTRFEVRPFATADGGAVREVIADAFGQEREARLVHRLRHCGALVKELVAVNTADRVIGSICFSRVTAAAAGQSHALSIVCLAPVSVLPDYRRLGIGAALVRTGLEALREHGEDLVLVLGSPAYFGRFGFDPELAKKVKGPYAGKAFMALALSDAGSLDLPVEVAFATPFEEFE